LALALQTQPLKRNQNSVIQKENGMNKDRVEGKVKDIAGRVERQAGEWTNDTNAQVKGAAKQVEGKVQNAWGQAKDATKKAAADAKTSKRPQSVPDDDIDSKESTEEKRRNRG
jgi:uncharacterized protein YjbJ (UPF0337 family)